MVQVAEAQRRFPNWFLWLLGVVFAVWAIGSINVSTPAVPAVSNPQVPQNVQENVGVAVPVVPAIQRPVAQPVQKVPVVIAPTVTLLTLKWGEYDWDKNPLGLGPYDRWGKDENGVIYSEGDVGGIRSGEFIGTGTARDAIVYIKDVQTVGPSSEDHRDFQLSPDKGKTWFKPVSLPPDFTPSFRIQGAIWRGDDILILANRQYKPWEYKHYVLRVTPEDTKRASQ